MTGQQSLKTADAPVYVLFAALFWSPVIYVAVVFFVLPHPDSMVCGPDGPCMIGVVSGLRDMWLAGFVGLAIVFWPSVLRSALAVHVFSVAAALPAVRRAAVYMLVLAGFARERRHA